MLKRRFIKIIFLGCFGFLVSMEFAMAELPVIAIVDFDTPTYKYRTLGEQVPELILDSIVNTGLFNVVERSKLKSIMVEQGFSGSGMVDPATAVKMGKLSGAKYLMTGKIISADAQTKEFRGYGVTTRTTIFHLKVNTRIFDTKTGRIVFSVSEDAEETSNESGGLRSSDSGLYVRLAEEVAEKITSKIKQSKEFKPEEPEEMQMVEVNFTSSPEAADVEIDGIFYGNAEGPVTVPAGLHIVKISLPGYEVWEKKVMLRKGGQSIRATLRKEADVRIEVQQ